MIRLLYTLLICHIFLLLACGQGERYETSSVFVTIDDFTHQFEPNSKHQVPVVITARGEKGWEGEVRLMVKKGEEVLYQTQQEVVVDKESEQRIELEIQLPEAEGNYEIVAEITGHHGKAVKNRRLIEVHKPLI
ncbi:MAG: hypothetical protein D6730_06775 [Bacteroidetes bacterium]|nr:MAG: hypothetical protein D6730_06775 [Bacteroidota bacterium]